MNKYKNTKCYISRFSFYGSFKIFFDVSTYNNNNIFMLCEDKIYVYKRICSRTRDV